MIDYQAHFEELRSLMMNAYPALTKDYFVSSFISRPNDELRPIVKMMQSATIKQAAEKARLQEMASKAKFTRHHIPMVIQPSIGQQLEGNLGTATAGWNPRVNTLTKSLAMDQRRQLGLCYRCGEKFNPSH